MAKLRTGTAYDALSAVYKARLKRGGIGREEYMQGKPLTASRGHAHTPEHGLKEARKNPDRYREYLKKRPSTGGQLPPEDKQRLIDQAVNNWRRLWKDTLYDTQSNISVVYYNVSQAEDDELRAMVKASYDMWWAHASRASRAKQPSPWFYHEEVYL